MGDFRLDKKLVFIYRNDFLNNKSDIMIRFSVTVNSVYSRQYKPDKVVAF